MKIKSKHRLLLLLMYIGFFIWSLYYYVPGVVFYYDQEDSKGIITQIDQNRVHLDYYHEDLKKKVSVSFREGNRLNLEKLEIDKNLDIKYSKKFPSRISIVDYHSAPGSGGMVMIIIFLAPLVLFKGIKF